MIIIVIPNGYWINIFKAKMSGISTDLVSYMTHLLYPSYEISFFKGIICMTWKNKNGFMFIYLDG